MTVRHRVSTEQSRLTPPPSRTPKSKDKVIEDATEVETEYEEMTETDVEPRHRRSHTDGLSESDSKQMHPPSQHGSRTLPDLEFDKPLSHRIETLRVRALWTLILVISFITVLAAGHFYVSILVVSITMRVYMEVISLHRNNEKENRLPLFFFLRWYWFCVTIFATGTVWLFPLSVGLMGRTHFIELIISHHHIITYIAAFLGLVLFILSLRRFSLRYQFSNFAFLLLTCLLVVGQSMVQIANIYSGLIWFFLSSSCVIVNDVFAYIVGTFFGRTRLLKLSPKKTVEGYIGASFVTIVWAFAVSSFLSKFPVFYCPEEYVSFRPFAMWTNKTCNVPPTFITKTYKVFGPLSTITGMDTIEAMPMQFHGLIIGVFAAFFAPFGGFFASGLKRALRIKDFGKSIPGHGGFTDRFDCQIMMGMFTYLYVKTFVFRRVGGPTIVSLFKAIKRLGHEDQIRLLRELQRLLGNTSLVSTAASPN